MSVMLRSTNPAAVGEIDPDKDRRRPYVGQIVLFHMRPGEGRAGKMIAPAIVNTVEDEDHIELTCIFSADDFVTRWKIPRRTEQNPINSWSFTAHDDKHYRPEETRPFEVTSSTPANHFTWDDVKVMHKEIGEMRNRLAAIEAKPKRGRPPGSGKHEPDNGEVEGAELASELGYDTPKE